MDLPRERGGPLARGVACAQTNEKGRIMRDVDARGLSCPEPALMAMDAIRDSAGETVRVLVSSATAKVNVEEIARRNGRTVETTREGDDYVLVIS